MDELIKAALKEAASNTKMSPQDEVDLLIKVLTEFLSSQLSN